METSHWLEWDNVNSHQPLYTETSVALRIIIEGQLFLFPPGRCVTPHGCVTSMSYFNSTDSDQCGMSFVFHSCYMPLLTVIVYAIVSCVHC